MAGHVLIIGGGVIGAACAHYLLKAGRRVTLIDQGEFGGGCSHGNCGFVCPSHVLPLAGPG
ncbi:MAG TPA: FAD-dependent oxidoreductase, partial [Pirellulales bacterium]|nr:FAD-dependent oxidoreductase [Pirellulales bacterium]